MAGVPTERREQFFISLYPSPSLPFLTHRVHRRVQSYLLLRSYIVYFSPWLNLYVFHPVPFRTYHAHDLVSLKSLGKLHFQQFFSSKLLVRVGGARLAEFECHQLTQQAANGDPVFLSSAVGPKLSRDTLTFKINHQILFTIVNEFQSLWICCDLTWRDLHVSPFKMNCFDDFICAYNTIW